MNQENEQSQALEGPGVVAELNEKPEKPEGTEGTEGAEGAEGAEETEETEETRPKRKFGEASPYSDLIKPDTPANPFQGTTRARRTFDVDPDAITASFNSSLVSGLIVLTEQVDDWRDMVDSFVHENKGVTFEEKNHAMQTYRLFVPGQGSGTCSGVLLGKFRNKAGRDIHLVLDPISETFNLIAEAVNPNQDDDDDDDGMIRWPLAAEIQLPYALEQSALQDVDQPPMSKKKLKLEIEATLVIMNPGAITSDFIRGVKVEVRN